MWVSESIDGDLLRLEIVPHALFVEQANQHMRQTLHELKR